MRLLLAWALLFTSGLPLAAEEAPAQVLLIGKQPDHPYGTHMYLHTHGVLRECLRLNGVEATVSDGWPAGDEQLENVQSIVLYGSPGAEMLLDGPNRDAFAGLMQRGTGLMTIHWASSVRKENLDRLGAHWMSYLGGTWISNVGLSVGKSQLRQLVPDHPICRGWQEYELHDEYYLNPSITDKATPLLQVNTKGKDVVVGWAFEREDGGRSYGTTLAHFYENIRREPFRRTLVNAILWTAQIEVPENGARVEVGEAVLELPPKPAE